MMCQACEAGDHGNCGLQTWCECDCDGTDDCFDPMAHYDPQDEDDTAERRVFTNCNVCGIKLRTDDEEKMGMCERCAAE